MLRSTMRTMFRRRMQDVSADQWSTDAEVNDLLNEGLHLVQREVVKVIPDAFMYIDSAPIVADTEFYPLPDGFWYELWVGLKASAGSTTYGKLTRGQYDRDRELARGNETRYDIRGRFITFQPIPNYSVSPGYQIQYVPTLSMGTDAVAPDLHQGLHMAVVLFAQLLALGETLESQTSTGEVLKSLLSDIPLFYQRGGEAQELRLDLGQPLNPSRYPFNRGSGIDTR